MHFASSPPSPPLVSAFPIFAYFRKIALLFVTVFRHGRGYSHLRSDAPDYKSLCDFQRNVTFAGLNFSLSLPPTPSRCSLLFSHPRSVNGCGSRNGAANQLGTHERSASERARPLERDNAIDSPALSTALPRRRHTGSPRLTQVEQPSGRGLCVRTSLQLRTSYARRNDVFATLLLSGTIASTCRRRSKAARNEANAKHDSHGHSARSRRVGLCARGFFLLPPYPVRRTLVSSRCSKKFQRPSPDISRSCETRRPRPVAPIAALLIVSTYR